MNESTARSAGIPEGGRAFPETIDGTNQEGGHDVTGSEDARPDGTNVVKFQKPETRDLIAKKAREIADLESEREEINAQINAKRKEVKAAGIQLKAFDLARRFYQLDEDQRREMDLSFITCRKAIDIPLTGDQLGLFEGNPEIE